MDRIGNYPVNRELGLDETPSWKGFLERHPHIFGIIYHYPSLVKNTLGDRGVDVLKHVWYIETMGAIAWAVTNLTFTQGAILATSGIIINKIVSIAAERWGCDEDFSSTCGSVAETFTATLLANPLNAWLGYGSISLFTGVFLVVVELVPNTVVSFCNFAALGILIETIYGPELEPMHQNFN